MLYDVNHPYAMQLAVMFNGVHQKSVIACDDEKGWVTRYVEPLREVRGQLVTEMLRGQVDVYINARYAAAFVATTFAQRTPPTLLLEYNNGK